MVMMSAKTNLSNWLVLADKGNLQQAMEALSQAIAVNPQDPEAYYGLGIVQARAKLLDEAEISFRQAIGLKPDFPAALNNLGTLLMNKNSLREAEICFKQAIELNSQYAEPYGNLGVVFINENNLDEAEVCLRQAIDLKTDFVEAYVNLGLVLKGTNRLEEAEVFLRRAIEINPDYPEAYNNLGLVLKYLYRVDEAEECLRHALDIRPDYPQANVNLGILLKDSFRLDEAGVCFNKVIDQYPDSVEAEFAQAILYLLQGMYDKWWEKYELRYKVFGYYRPEIRHWLGEDLSGCKILLYYEQGFGDIIQFIRYAQLVAERALQTIVWVQKPLQQLLIDSPRNFSIFTGDEIQPELYDFACSLLSLPAVFKTTQNTIPRVIPYLQPGRDVSTKWRNILEKTDNGKGCRIGVVWSGNPNHRNDRNRSIPFDSFRELFDIADVNWISLQAGERAWDLASVASQVLNLTSDLVDFSETAGIISNLDLVIAVDTAVAHLTGALGKKIWLLLPFSPDWRWQVKREDSDWYPTMRIFRQQKTADWSGVLKRVKKAICKKFLPSLPNIESSKLEEVKSL